MDQTHKDDATRRLGRALVYIISLAHEDEAADAESVSEAPSASATGGTLDDEEPQERSRRVENGDGRCQELAGRPRRFGQSKHKGVVKVGRKVGQGKPPGILAARIWPSHPAGAYEGGSYRTRRNRSARSP